MKSLSLNVCCNHSIFSFIIVINKNRRAPAVKYDHTASSGGLWPLSCQQLHQQLGDDKEMHILDYSQTLKLSPVALMTPIIFRVCVWSCIIS